MTDVGKAMRMKRVIDPSGVSVICALDHGMTSPQFLEPLADIVARTRETVAGGANVIMMSKGMIRLAQPAFAPTTSLALLLSASANPEGGSPEVVRIADVEEALRLGADCVVLFTALGGDTEAGMIEMLVGGGHRVRGARDAVHRRGGVPDHVRIGRGAGRPSTDSNTSGGTSGCAPSWAADIVKTNWPGDAAGFAKLVEAANGIPVVLAGGSRLSDEELLRRMEEAMAAGGIGCSVGRNIFMHESPEAVTRALSRVIRERWTAEKALAALGEETGR